MAKTYIIAKGDTLAKIARDHLGDAKLADVLADYNGLSETRYLFVGQRIQLPSARDRRPATLASTEGETAPRAAWPSPPHGFQAIRDTFGDLVKYVRNDGTLDPKWEMERMVPAKLPFAIPLSWAPATKVTSVRCHKLIAPLIEELFRQIVAQGLKSAVKTYGGCYIYRDKRGQVKPSTHSWGIAIDLNPNTNSMGTAGDMDPRLVALFETHGFFWGGRWTGRSRDPMHFQYCTGY